MVEGGVLEAFEEERWTIPKEPEAKGVGLRPGLWGGVSAPWPQAWRARPDPPAAPPTPLIRARHLGAMHEEDPEKSTLMRRLMARAWWEEEGEEAAAEEEAEAYASIMARILGLPAVILRSSASCPGLKLAEW